MATKLLACVASVPARAKSFSTAGRVKIGARAKMDGEKGGGASLGRMRKIGNARHAIRLRDESSSGYDGLGTSINLHSWLKL